MHLYRVVLWRDKDKTEQIGIFEAKNAFEAEEIAKESAKKWEAQGFAFHGVFYEGREVLDAGKVLWF